MRVGSGTGTTGLSWLFGDHLGSTSITADSSGNRTAELRYKGWGENRYSYGTTGTTYRFTGQRQESSLGGPEGLYYYGARWYDSTLGRFAQADGVMPGGVQGMDRYAYVNNNPVVYTDPSGNETCDADGYCGDYSSNTDPLTTLIELYGIVFTGVWDNPAEIWAVLSAVMAVGQKLLSVNPSYGTNYEAFRSVFGTITFQMGNCDQCNGSGGYAANAQTIEFASMAADWRTDKLFRDINLVVHELGHVFDIARRNDNWSPSIALSNDQSRDPKFPNRGDYPDPTPKDWTGDTTGFASRQNILTWQMSVTNAGSAVEEFADQFVGWTFSKFEASDAGFQRARWMSNNMPNWLNP